MYTYEELKEFVDHCTRCVLCKTRNHPVMGKGNLNSPVLFFSNISDLISKLHVFLTSSPIVYTVPHFFKKVLLAPSESRRKQLLHTP